MKYFILYPISILLLSIAINAQSLKIVKIYDTNLFKLENYETVKLHGLYIPSKSDTSESLAMLGQDIFEWEQKYLLDKTFKVEYVKKVIKGISEVVLYLSDKSSEENLAITFLNNGYATLVLSEKNELSSGLLAHQEKAQKEGIGIWSLDVLILQSLKEQSQDNSKPLLKNYERPYLPLLSISAVLLAFTWDSYASASDIQKTIDGFKAIDSNFDSSELESSKTRKQILGVTCLVGAVLTAIFAFKTVEIKTDLNFISISYRF